MNERRAKAGAPPRVVLYSSAECWRGASISFAHIAHGLQRRGCVVQAVSVRDDVSHEFARLGVPACTLLPGKGESRRLRQFLHGFGADLLMVDRVHDLRVGTLAVTGTDVALVSRYNVFARRPPRDLLTRLAYRVALREVVFLSRAAQTRVVDEAPFMRRVPATTIYEGIDVDLFRPGTRAAQAFRARHELGDAPFLLAVGALSAEKRYDVLLDALERLGDAAPTLVVCGEGAEGTRLRARVRDRGPDVRFVGRVPRAELVGAYSACLGLVHAGDVETFGLAVLEGMSCARPVIAADGGALPEVVGESGVCGVLVPSGCRDSFATAIRRLVDEPEHRAQLGARARERARQNFSLESMEDGYSRLVSRRTARLEAAP